MKKHLDYLAVSVAVILWGFSFLWTNQLLISRVPVYTFIFFRMALAGILLWLFSVLTHRLQKVRGKDWWWLLLMVFFEPFIYFIGETFGLKVTGSPTVSAIVVATIPIFTMISGRVFFKERLSGLNIFGIFLTIPGILLVMYGKDCFTVRYFWGILLLFLAVAGSVGYSTVVKKIADRYNAFTIASYQFIFGALFFLPLFLICDVKTFSWSMFTWEMLYPLLALAILCSSLAFVLYINSIKRVGLTRTSIFTALIPAVSAIGAFFMGQEELGALKLTGMALVIAGVIIAQHK